MSGAARWQPSVRKPLTLSGLRDSPFRLIFLAISILFVTYLDSYVAACIGDDWAALTILGAISALLGFGMDYCISYVQNARMHALGELSNGFFMYLAWVLFSVATVTLAVGVTHYISPHAIGSGIPEMKTILNGVSLKEYLTLRTGISKTLGLLLVQFSGLPIGKEGPFVHLASIIANQLIKLVPLFRKISLNEARRLEFLAAACAVGVASNFAAPIGGMLFSIEVTATYFAVRNYWRGFYASVIGAFTFRALAVVVHNEQTITALFTTQFDQYPFDMAEMVAFVAIGIACGFIGAFFVYAHRRIVDAQRWYTSCELHGPEDPTESCLLGRANLCSSFVSLIQPVKRLAFYDARAICIRPLWRWCAPPSLSHVCALEPGIC